MKTIIWVVLAGGVIVTAAVLLWPSAPEPPSALPQYNGRTFEQVGATLGTPLRTESFGVSRALDQMRGPLRSKVHRSASQPAGQDIVIKEAVWLDGDYFLTIWFQEVEGTWIAIDGLRWHKDICF